MGGHHHRDDNGGGANTAAHTVVSFWMEAQERIKGLVKDAGSLVDGGEPETVRQEFLRRSLDVIVGILFHEVDVSDGAFHAVERSDADTDGVGAPVKYLAMVERGLWKYGFYTVIHEYRSLLKVERSIEVMDKFVVFLDGAISWYSCVLTEIQGRYDAQSSSRLNEEQIRMVRSRCHVCIGDLHRYKLQYCRPENNNTVGGALEKESRDAYIDAIRQWPFMGSPFNQIAVLYGMVSDHFRSLFYYVRAATAREAFASAEENMAILLQKVSSSGDNVSSKTHNSGDNSKKKGGLKKKKKKKKKGAEVMSSSETIADTNNSNMMTEQRWVRVFSMLFFQIDVDNVPRVWQDGYGDLEEYLNRRLQRARKLASRSKPTFGKSRMFSNDAPYLHQSRVFQDLKDDSTLMMMVQMLLLLMQGKLEHAKCTSLRLKLTRAQGYMVVLNLAGRLASLVGRCQSILTKYQQHPHGVDIVSSEFWLPLVLLLSWISKDWNIHGDASLLMCRQACEDYPKNEIFFEKTLFKFFGGLASMARALMPHGRHVYGDKGKLSRLSQIGIIHGCTLLEVIVDYPLVVSKKMRERQGIVDHRVPRRQRDKAFGMHIASWTLIHHLWTMLGEISSQVNETDVSLGFNDTFSGLRKSIAGLVAEIVTTGAEEEDDAMDVAIWDNTNDTSMHDQEEDIVYVARKRKEKKRDAPTDHNMIVQEQSERMMMASSMGMEEDVGHGFDENYNTYRLAHEMAADVLFDDGFEIGPSQVDQFRHEDASGIDIGTIPTRYHDR